MGKRHSTADAQLNQGERRRSILTAHDSFHGRTGGGACRLSEFGAVATLHGLGEESDLAEQPVVKFGLTLDGRLGVRVRLRVRGSLTLALTLTLILTVT